MPGDIVKTVRRARTADDRWFLELEGATEPSYAGTSGGGSSGGWVMEHHPSTGEPIVKPIDGYEARAVKCRVLGPDSDPSASSSPEAAELPIYTSPRDDARRGSERQKASGITLLPGEHFEGWERLTLDTEGASTRQRFLHLVGGGWVAEFAPGGRPNYEYIEGS